jgi:hypothetical protein
MGIGLVELCDQTINERGLGQSNSASFWVVYNPNPQAELNVP